MSEWKKGDDALSSEKSRRAAMYVRMSTDHQKYSTENQADAIQEYAQKRKGLSQITLKRNYYINV